MAHLALSQVKKVKSPSVSFLDFQSPRLPKWNGSDIEKLISNSIGLAQSDAAKSLGYSHLCGTKKVYDDGRTRATVLYIPGIHKVFKTNHDVRLDNLEFRIHRSLADAGVNVPIVESCGNGFVMDCVGEHSLRGELYRDSALDRKSNDLENHLAMLVRMAKLISTVDHVVGETLTQEDKDFLQERETARIAEKMGVSNQVASQNYFILRMLAAIPNADQRTVNLLEPLKEVMEDATRKYGSWSADLHPGNLFPFFDGENFDDFFVIDFNRIRYAPMQMAESLAFDQPLILRGIQSRAEARSWWNMLTKPAPDGRNQFDYTANPFGMYSPIFFQERKFADFSDYGVFRRLKNLFSEVDNKLNPDNANVALGSPTDQNVYITSPCDEMTRRALTGQRLREKEKLTGENFDDEDREVLHDYALTRMGVRAYVNLLQARYTLGETMKAPDFQTLFNKFLATQHHLNLAVYCLEQLSRDQTGNRNFYQSLIDHVVEKYTQVAQQIPEYVTQTAEAWFRS